MPCILFIPLPTARKPYWRQSGWTVDICERNERETSPPRPVPSSSISAQAEQGWQASPVGPGAGSITSTFLLKGEPTLRRCLLTFSKSHSEVGWLCGGNTRGRNVKQVAEAMAVNKSNLSQGFHWRSHTTKDASVSPCKTGRQGGRTWAGARSALKAGVSSGGCLDEAFLPAPQGPFQGRSTGKWVLLLTWVGQAAPHVPVPGSPHSTKVFHALPFPFLQRVPPPVYSQAYCVSIRRNTSVAFSTTNSKIFLLFHLQRETC